MKMVELSFIAVPVAAPSPSRKIPPKPTPCHFVAPQTRARSRKRLHKAELIRSGGPVFDLAQFCPAFPGKWPRPLSLRAGLGRMAAENGRPCREGGEKCVGSDETAIRKSTFVAAIRASSRPAT